MIKVRKDFNDGRNWGKSSLSGDNGGDCVGVTMDDQGRVSVDDDGQVGIRDTKEDAGPVLWISAAEFGAIAKHLAN